MTVISLWLTARDDSEHQQSKSTDDSHLSIIDNVQLCVQRDAQLLISYCHAAAEICVSTV